MHETERLLFASTVLLTQLFSEAATASEENIMNIKNFSKILKSDLDTW